MKEDLIDVNTYILEEDKKYIELDRLKKDNNEYILLYEENNITNITIRKIVKEEILYLDQEEFYEVISLFKEKNENLFN